ncbi:Ger(x)C family spore germination C-terminal domain-containing protein [Paenibacillus rhizoplanae]
MIPRQAVRKSNVEQTDPGTKLHYEGVAVFKGDKLLGWIDDDYTAGFNYVTDNVTKKIRGTSKTKPEA